jgi:uncharacterized membrane protein YjjP (DUF1212 family)
MSNNDNSEKSTGASKQKSGEINHLLPKITNDEVDLEVDTRRDDEIKADKPPHHT